METATDTVLLNVCIVPGEETKAKSIELSKQLDSADTLFTVDGLQKFPHMTLYMARFTVDHIPEVQDSISRALENTSKVFCEHSGFLLTDGNYAEISYKKSEDLIQLHGSLIEAVKSCRYSPGMPREESYFAPYTEEQRRNAAETGYDLSHDLFRPHITLTRYRENHAPLTLPTLSSEGLSFTASIICLYKADDNGAVYEKIAEYTLK